MTVSNQKLTFELVSSSNRSLAKVFDSSSRQTGFTQTVWLGAFHDQPNWEDLTSGQHFELQSIDRKKRALNVIREKRKQPLQSH